MRTSTVAFLPFAAAALQNPAPSSSAPASMSSSPAMDLPMPSGALANSPVGKDGQQWTTSIVYATSIHTVTSCGPEVTNCPAHSTVPTTIIVPLSTTICPVTEAEAHMTPSAPTSVVSPVPKTASSVVPVESSMSEHPSAKQTPVAVPSSVSMNSPVEETPCPEEAVTPAANDHIGTVVAHPTTSSPHAYVTAGGAQNVAGGAAAALAIVAALL